MEKLKRYSKYLHKIFVSIFVLGLVTTATIVLIILFINKIGLVEPGLINKLSYEFGMQYPVPAGKIITSLAILIPILGFEISILYCLMKLFGLYARGFIFEFENIRYIRWIGYSMISSQIGTIIALYILPSFLFIKTESDLLDICSKIITGLIIVCASWIMEEGRKLKQEQDLTV